MPFVSLFQQVLLPIKSMIQNEFAKTVLEYGMFNTGDKVVVGVSGGSDSVCLLHLLSGLKKLRLELIVAHFNHRLRGKESERDEKFVKKTSEELGLPFVSDSASMGFINLAGAALTQEITHLPSL